MSNSTCSVAECEEPVNCRGMCKPHYRKDYYLRNKAHENATNKAYLGARPEYQKARSAAYGELRWGAERMARKAAVESRLAATHKECTKCADYLPKSEFHSDTRRRDGLYSSCKSCFRLTMRSWEKRNPDVVAMKSRNTCAVRKARKLGQAHGEPVNYPAILERDGMTCHLCGDDIPSLDSLHFDHVIPLSKGGAHSMANIKPSHARCNLSKGAKLIA